MSREKRAGLLCETEVHVELGSASGFILAGSKNRDDLIGNVQVDGELTGYR